MDDLFQLTAPFKPTGDRPKAIEKLVAGLKSQQRFQTLLGAIGTGKTFTIAATIAQHQKPPNPSTQLP
jgi:excinuclease ABC subunit B